MSGKKSSRTYYLLLLGTCFLAIALRVLAITSRPLWYDEAFSVLFSENGLTAMMYGTLTPVNGSAADVHPLAYYTLLWLWMNIFGDSLLSVRLLSVLFGLGVVLVAYCFTRSMLDRWTALMVALLVAISPFQIHYSQEIRMYALLTFLLLIATWSMWEGVRTNRWYWWVAFSMAAAFAQYTHNLAAFYLVPLALTPILARRWKVVLPVVLASLGAMLLYLPWLVRLPEQLAKVQLDYWTIRPSPARLVTTLLSFSTNLPLPDTWLPLALFITILSLTLAAYQTIRAVRLGAPNRQLGLWLAYLTFIPPLLLYTFSQWKPMYIERALLPSGVMYLIWLAWALTQPNLSSMIRIIVFSLIFIAMGMGIYQHVNYRGYPYAPSVEIMQSLRERLATGDLILHSDKLTMLPGVYYERALPQEYLVGLPGSNSDTLALPTQKVLGLMAIPSSDAKIKAASRVWFIIFSKGINESIALGLKTHPHLTWLEKNFQIAHVEAWGDVLLYEFVR